MFQDFSVVDCDGHILESIPEMAEFMDDGLRKHALQSYRNREGVFPSLDGIHGSNSAMRAKARADKGVTASEYRTGSGEDWLAFLDKIGIEKSVLFTSEGLSVGLIQIPEYAVAVCKAYNDYVHDRYARVSSRLRPMALIPMQDVRAAVRELRRAVLELGLPGAMIPSTGQPLHLGHEMYWPIYEVAEKLDCVLAVHGGSSRGIGLDTFTVATASHILRHPLPLMIALVSLIYDGVLDQFPNLRVAFMEGGCGWLPCLLDRMKRDNAYYSYHRITALDPLEYIANGRILIGCEGGEQTLSYVIKRVGVKPFAYASDYPHEIDFLAAKREIEEIAERGDLSSDEKQAILGGNAKRFFNCRL